jgi:hypothetical protein
VVDARLVPAMADPDPANMRVHGAILPKSRMYDRRISDVEIRPPSLFGKHGEHGPGVRPGTGLSRRPAIGKSGCVIESRFPAGMTVGRFHGGQPSLGEVDPVKVDSTRVGSGWKRSTSSMIGCASCRVVSDTSAPAATGMSSRPASARQWVT